MHWYLTEMRSRDPVPPCLLDLLLSKQAKPESLGLLAWNFSYLKLACLACLKACLILYKIFGVIYKIKPRQSPGTTIPHNRDYLAISKPARATIANFDLNNKALFTCVILQYSTVYFNRILSLFVTTRMLSLRGPNSKYASFISLIRVYRNSLSLSL